MLLGFLNDSSLASGWNWIPMSCRSICGILWANSLSVRIEVNVIDNWTNISLELTTMPDSRRVARMQQSCTIFWLELSTYSITCSNHLQETSRRNKTPIPKNHFAFVMSLKHPKSRNKLSLTPWMLFFSSPLAAHLFPSNAASPLLLLLPHSLPAPMCYPSRSNLPISLRIPNQFPQSLGYDLLLIGQHDLCLNGLSVAREPAATRLPNNH